MRPIIKLTSPVPPSGGSRVPVVVSSGYLDVAVERRLQRGAFQGFLAKPYSVTPSSPPAGVPTTLSTHSKTNGYGGTSGIWGTAAPNTTQPILMQRESHGPSPAASGAAWTRNGLGEVTPIAGEPGGGDQDEANQRGNTRRIALGSGHRAAGEGRWGVDGFGTGMAWGARRSIDCDARRRRRVGRRAVLHDGRRRIAGLLTVWAHRAAAQRGKSLTGPARQALGIRVANRRDDRAGGRAGSGTGAIRRCVSAGRGRAGARGRRGSPADGSSARAAAGLLLIAGEARSAVGGNLARQPPARRALMDGGRRAGTRSARQIRLRRRRAVGIRRARRGRWANGALHHLE